MGEFEITIKFNGKYIGPVSVAENTSFEEIKKQYVNDEKDPVVLALFRGQLRELAKTIQASA